MIKIDKIRTYGFDAAIWGMRNPLNSWDKSDSNFCADVPTCEGCVCFEKDEWGEDSCSAPPNENFYIIGEKDLELAKRLAKAGPVHAKYRRFMQVTMDITAPFYWWKEWDTYKVGTVSNSCSTMHTIMKHLLTREDFSHELLSERSLEKLDDTIGEINYWIDQYNYCKKHENEVSVSPKYYESCFNQVIQLLPSSYNQKRTVLLNYEVLYNMFSTGRKNHKLHEWRQFYEFCKELPYSDLFLLEEKK